MNDLAEQGIYLATDYNRSQLGAEIRFYPSCGGHQEQGQWHLQGQPETVDASLRVDLECTGPKWDIYTRMAL